VDLVYKKSIKIFDFHTFISLPLYLLAWGEKSYTSPKVNKMQTTVPSQNDITNEIGKQLLQENCKDIGIYGLQNRLSPDKWYIGQTINPIGDRWDAYRNLDCKYQIKLLRALKKYGYEQFNKVVLEVCPPDKAVLNERETYWIKHYNSIKGGYNIREGGTAGRMTDATKKKMSQAHLGKKFTEEHRRKLSIAATGRKGTPMTPEHKQKLMKILIGRVVSNETRIKLGNASRGRKYSEEIKARMRKSRWPHLYPN
jgi:group I intron endonuclease